MYLFSLPFGGVGGGFFLKEMPCYHSRACFGSPLTACQQKLNINPLVIYILYQ